MKRPIKVHLERDASTDNYFVTKLTNAVIVYAGSHELRVGSYTSGAGAERLVAHGDYEVTITPRK